MVLPNCIEAADLATNGKKFTAKTTYIKTTQLVSQQQIDFAMQNAAKSGWAQWYGAGRVGIGDNEGIPDKPLSTKYRPIEIIPTDGADVQQKYKPMAERTQAHLIRLALV